MKCLALLALMTFSASAFAEDLSKDGVAIAKKQSNGNILLGRVHLDEADNSENQSDNDTFSLPQCGSAGALDNVRITRLRLVSPKNKLNGNANLDALIKKVTIVFNNGEALIFEPSGNQGKLIVGENSGDGMGIPFGTDRCVRSVTVIGEQYENGKAGVDAMVQVMGIQ